MRQKIAEIRSNIAESTSKTGKTVLRYSALGCAPDVGR